MVRIVVMALILVGCQTHEIRYAPMRCMEVEKPELEALPPIADCDNENLQAGEECVHDETWYRIKDRDTDLRHYAEKLKASCDMLDRLATEAEEE